MPRQNRYRRHDPPAKPDQKPMPRIAAAGGGAELQRLKRDEGPDSLASALARLRGIATYPSLTSEANHELRVLRSGYLAMAAELDAIAKAYRIAERDLHRQVTSLLERWERQLSAVGTEMAGLPSAASRAIPRVGRRRRRLWPDVTAVQSHSDAEVRVQPQEAPLAVAAPLTVWFQLPSATWADADVTARVLGPLEVTVGGRHIAKWPSLKAKTLFQYLLLNEGRPIRRDLLMELQWPDHTYNSARNNLNVALSNLRAILQAPAQPSQPILYRDGCYRLNPELTWWIDRTEFRSVIQQAQLASRASEQKRAIDLYDQAVQLYRGPLFEEEPTDHWFLAEQHQLKELYLQALERLAEIYCDAGELSSAVRFGQLATAVDRCRESAHRTLMRCFAEQHQQQLVCRQYLSCVTALRDDLDVLPGHETVQLFHQLTSS